LHSPKENFSNNTGRINLITLTLTLTLSPQGRGNKKY